MISYPNNYKDLLKKQKKKTITIELTTIQFLHVWKGTKTGSQRRKQIPGQWKHLFICDITKGNFTKEVKSGGILLVFYEFSDSVEIF